MAKKRARPIVARGLDDAPGVAQQQLQQSGQALARSQQQQPDVAMADGEARQQQGVQGEEEARPGPSRRAGMADIARKRAAHFAHFKESDDEQEGGNVHVGTGEARRLGPWSSAVELVNARERAQQERQDKILHTARDAAEEAQASWQPSRDPSQGPHPSDCVQPLFDACLDVLANYIDCVETLWGVPDTIKVRLAAHVCTRRRMSPEVSQLFSSCAPSEAAIPDCVQLDVPAMQALIKDCATAKLQRLELGSCGRGFGDESAAVLAGCGPLPELTVLSLSGAYRLTDDGLTKVLAATPNLACLAVEHATRLTGALMPRLPQLVPKLRTLNLTGCRGIGAEALSSALPQLAALHTLVLDGNPEVDDAVVGAAARLPCLRDLSVRYCQAVTDTGMTALAAMRPELEALHVDECAKLSDQGLGALGSQCKALKVFSARRCHRLGDAALAGLVSRGTLQHLVVNGCTGVAHLTMGALVSTCKESLESLDVSFCRKIPDSSLGLLLDRCTKLRRITVFGLNQITKRTLYGHSNADLKVEGLHTSINLNSGGGSGKRAARPPAPDAAAGNAVAAAAEAVEACA